MRLHTQNEYILLKDNPGDSPFSSPSSGSFIVAEVEKNGICKTGDVVFLYPDSYQTIRIENEEYTIAKLENILGVQNAA